MGGEAFGLGPGEFERIARPSCDDCGNRDLRWMSLGALALQIGGDDLAEPLAWWGPFARAWFCPRCSNLGVFGPLETGQPH